MASTHTSSTGPLHTLFAQPTSILTHTEELSSDQLPKASTSLEGAPLLSLFSHTAQATPIQSTQPFIINSPNSTLPFIRDSSKSTETLMGSSTSIDGILDIALHHAKGIHNICIYGNQDVYAKFSITHTQDAVYSTQPIRGGGKNPVFNQSLQILISKLDAVLKCEIWMMSCARTYLEDQLLGFVLVPLCDLMGQGRVTKDYSLSSTDLFHTPAGTICLSLTFYLRGADIPLYGVPSDTSTVCTQNGLHTLEGNDTHDMKCNDAPDIMSDNTHDTSMDINQCMTPMEYNNIEFPDFQDACENQRMVSVFMNMASDTDARMEEDACGKDDERDQIRSHVSERDFSDASFLQLGPSYDSEMGIQNEEEKSHNSAEEHADISSRDTPVSKAKEVHFLDSTPTLAAEVLSPSVQKTINAQQATSSLTMGEGLSSPDVKVGSRSNEQGSQSSFSARLVEPDEPVIQQQIVDMYLKSMQQFTESLAKMKLPLDLDNAQNHAKEEKEQPKAEPTSVPASKDGHKVFYGSRAFF